VNPTDVFGSTPGRVLTGATGVAAVLLVAVLVGEVPVADLVLAASLGGLAVLVVWALLGRPDVEVSDGTVVLHNVLRTVTIPWPTVLGTEVGWSFAVLTTAGRWVAWAAPRASGTARAMRRRRPTGEADDVVAAAGGPLPAGAPPQGPPGGRRRHAATAEAVAAAVDERLAVLRLAGHLDDAERMVAEHGLRPTVTWNSTTLAWALGLALVAAATRLV
jgi:hypothetical protein